MSNIYTDYKDALSLYNNGCLTLGFNAKEYYKKLCDMVVSEYREQGFCRLIDKMIEIGGDIESVSYHSLENARDILKGKNKNINIEYCPVQIPNKLCVRSSNWEELGKYMKEHGTHIIYTYNDKARDMLVKLRENGQECHLSKLKSHILTDTNKVIIENNVLNKANTEAERIITKAKEESHQIKEEARIEAERIIAESDVVKCKQSNDASKLSKELIQEYLTRERDTLRKTLDQEYEYILDENHVTLGKAERIHDEMCDYTNKLQISWVKALDGAVKDLTNIKEDFYKKIHNWQVGLYPHEIRPLAERYIELYSIANIDKIIAEELFRINSTNNTTNQERKTTEIQLENAGTVTVVDESQGETLIHKYNTSPVLEELEKLNRNLSIFLKKFEFSLNGLDMYVYYPEDGEVYDEVWHVIEDDAEFDASKEHRIKQCILPGIAKKVNDDSEDDVIIMATVKV